MQDIINLFGYGILIAIPILSIIEQITGCRFLAQKDHKPSKKL